MLENTTSDDVIKIIDHLKEVVTPLSMEVYKIYYKQMIYTGVINTTFDLAIVIGIPVISYYIFKHRDKFVPIHNWVYANDLEWIEMCGGIGLIIVCIITVIIFFGTLGSMQSDLMHIINPDYYIIQSLLGR